ncbi:tRNA epoxyqueuosine(34) reductase QueG [Mariniblastus fucicola]|uniref:Epoxyqueuosine reductase n=1 Tax=Mariniblastus fucicola TaxID=980251 RepID=A0A5B9PCN6_9BACT|nr:tRNA epoxyqueuosine(34) reductase QueG [Mariniblastus fucicola]QEG22306.1 Epoxyqueuosine reductase [Mariniblastus fucicola]
MNTAQLTQSLKQEAKRLGFDFAAVTAALAPDGFSRLDSWVERGFHGEMDYLETRREAYQHPAGVLPAVRSVMMLGMSYHVDVASLPQQPGLGRVARYAWGQGDYHDFLHRKLKQLCRFAREAGDGIAIRGVVDTAPLLEREFAQLAGMGWHAKNTMLINRELGSWFLIAAVLTDAELEIDTPMSTSHCGTCTACLDACPTDAFVEPGTLDATKCISYLTIEHRSPIPIELRSQMGDWILGCDVCQDVCPWNNKAKVSSQEVFQPVEALRPLNLHDLFRMDDDQFRVQFRKTPLWRPKRRGILRNAAITLGNMPSGEGLESLAIGINDDEPLVRGACVWAIGQHLETFGSQAMELLRNRRTIECDADVQTELDLAMQS